MSDDRPRQKSDRPRQESLDETRARLELDGPPAPPDTIPPDTIQPAVVTSSQREQDEPLDPGAPRPKRRRTSRRKASATAQRSQRSKRRTANGARVVAIAIVAVVAVVAIAHGFIDGPGDATTSVSAWKHYPGTAYATSADVLSAPSKEATAAEAEAFLSDYRNALTTEFGMSWTTVYDGYSDIESNGYGGDSMLYDYASPQWQGSVVLDDPEARKKAFALFGKIATEHGATDVWLANEVYADDASESKKSFGAAKQALQPEWRFYGDGAVVDGATVSSTVIDLNLPRDPSFDGDDWFVLDDVPAGSFVVEVDVSADDLLATSDRDTFRRALAPYDESDKPEPH